MSFDLILGNTSRDWACGGGAPAVAITPPTPDPGMEAASRSDPAALAQATNDEIAETASLFIRLSRSKRIPPADHDAYRKFHAAWIAYSDQHARDWAQRDNLSLWNFRQIDKQFNARFKVFDTVAKTPITKPGAPGTDMVAAAPSPGHPVAVLLGTGLAIGALAWLGGQKKWRPV